MSSTTKAKLARKRQKETLKFIQQQQQAETNEIEPQPPGTSQETDEWLEYKKKKNRWLALVTLLFWDDFSIANGRQAIL